MAKAHVQTRSMLQELGWVGYRPGSRALRRGCVVWAPHGVGSSMSRYTDNEFRRGIYTITFDDVPAHVIVATCEAAAKGERRFGR